MNLLTAIRIFLYGFCSYFAFTAESLSGFFIGVGCVVMAIVILVVDYKSQEIYDKREQESDDLAKGPALDAIGQLYGVPRKEFKIMGIGRRETDVLYRARLKEKVLGVKK